MKKKILPLAFIAVAVIALCFLFAGCGDYQNGYDDGYSIGLSEGNRAVTMREATSGNGTSLVETIEELRQQVVDVYATAKSATYAGSGVIVASDSSNSWIITNHHVIEGCYSFEIDVLSIMDDGQATEIITTYAASFVGGSPKDDIAVLRVNKGNLPCATWLADSNKVKVGTEVIAIGNPLGVLGGTVTKGIISATARAIEVDGIGIMKLMQTDAAINSGNSGGGLYSTDGLLVGIVNSGYTDYEGLNFAIPANDAKATAIALIETYKAGSTYGYVQGRNNIGIILYYTSVYETSSRLSTIDIIYSYRVDANGDAAQKGFGKTTEAATAITKIEYEGKTYTYTSSEYYSIYNYYLEMSSLLGNIEIGKSIKLTGRSVKQSGNPISGYYYYLDPAVLTYTITATQYIYTPPAS